ncbi:hypothetical protein C4M83_01060, partial [Mycoplasmopsis pullorum]
YNITQYYTIKEVDGKKKRRYFKYYHHDYLKQVGKSKYSSEAKKLAFDVHFNGSKRPKWMNINTYNSWIKQQRRERAISEKLCDKIQNSINSESNLLKKYEVKPEHNGVLYVEMDDTYKKYRIDTGASKLMCRMLTFNLFNWKTGQFECVNNVQIYFETHLKDNKYNDDTELKELIKWIKNNYYDTNLKICIKGDGAWNIKQVAKHFEYSVLDLFHLNRYVNLNFCMKKWFRIGYWKDFKIDFSVQNYREYWEKILSCYRIIDWDKLHFRIKEWISERESSNVFIKALTTFSKYINNNKRSIFDIPNEINKQSHTESYVRNYFKKYVYKQSTLYNSSTIIRLVRKNFDPKIGLLQIY